MSNYAQQIRDFTRQSYVEPARRAGSPTFEILAGDVHNSLRLTNQFPNVCQTLRGNKFLEENRIVLERFEGPPKGNGARAKFTFRFIDSGANQPPATPATSPLMGLRGIAKHVFRSLGGAEAFIRSQRDTFDRTEPGS